jgi:hypothetical protein
LRTRRRRFANAVYDGRLATAIKPLVMDGEIAAASDSAHGPQPCEQLRAGYVNLAEHDRSLRAADDLFSAVSGSDELDGLSTAH